MNFWSAAFFVSWFLYEYSSSWLHSCVRPAHLHELGELALDLDVLRACSARVFLAKTLVCVHNVVAFKCHSFVINSAAF